MFSIEVFTVIDVETTGLDYKTEQIIEIAAVKFTDDGREVGRFQTLVELEDGRELPEFITELTGIEDGDLYGASTELCAGIALYAFCYGTTVIVHHAPFDLSFFDKYGNDKAPLADNFICTRVLTKLVEPTESASLKNVCERHGIELNGHHRAMNDVLATWEIFRIMRDKADADGIEYRNIVINSDERPLTFIPHNAIVKEAI